MFVYVLADDAESRQVSMLLRVRFRAARSRCRRREQLDGAVRENAIHVEQDDLDFLCAINEHEKSS